MAKIKLGSRPKSFTRTVKVELLDGSEGAITCTFKYRTRTEFGVFIDSIVDKAKAAGKSDATPTAAGLMELSHEASADYLLQILEGWDLDEEFNRANVEQLCNELPAAAAAVMETYRAAISEGRLGN